MTTIDPATQAQVDAQLLEQGAFAPLDLLLNSGRLMSGDYESWRRGELASLDDVLMGNPEKIRAQLEDAVRYARGIGLVEQEQQFYGWNDESAEEASGSGHAPPSRARPAATKALRISADEKLSRLIASRYTPAQNVPQMDLFFDNPVVALTNGIVRALSARNVSETRRQLDNLYAHEPNHADLGAFDGLLGALERLSETAGNAQEELDFLAAITPTARRLMSSQARDLLAPLWRRLADALDGVRFDPERPDLHRSFALTQAQDWPAVSECVLGEPEWWRHAALCTRLAQSGFYRRKRSESLAAWSHLCWLHEREAAEILDGRRQPDAELTAAWDALHEFADELEAEPGWRDDSTDGPLPTQDFPAWLLLRDPALAEQLPADLPKSETPGENAYRCVHRWIRAHQAGRQDEEMALRRELQAIQPALFSFLKRSVGATRQPQR